MASEKTVQPETLRYSADAGNAELSALCGPLDENLRQIETILNVRVSRRGDVFRVTGELEAARRAVTALAALMTRVKRTGEELSVDDIQWHFVGHDDEYRSGAASDPEGAVDDVDLKVRRRDLQGRTPNQRLYLKAIMGHDISFGVGPAGTMGFEKSQRLMERQSIEVAPLAYMRGRTLNNAFVILDEAQNTTPEQMKMFLTRIGFGSKAVITGDVTQIDLPKGVPSGLKHAIRILDGVRGIEITRFTSKDVVRHPLVARIVDAYEEAAKQDELAAKARKEVKE